MITTSEYVLGPTPEAVDRGYGYTMSATPNCAAAVAPTVCVYTRQQEPAKALHLFVTPADARAFAAQLTAAADAIDPEGAGQ